MTAMYQGIKGTHAMQQILPQTFPTGGTPYCSSCPKGYAYLVSGGNSTRQSGSMMLRRRLHNGFTASLNYTYSKSIDDAALAGQGQGGSLIAQNWLALEAERALSNFDQRHLLQLNGQYTSGMGLKGGTLMNGWKGPLLKDWTFASTLNLGSGKPLNPFYSVLAAGSGVSGTIRPDYTGAGLYAAPNGRFLNPAAFVAAGCAFVSPCPATGTGKFGNAGRNSITGPRTFVLNASLARTFRMSDRLNADLRFDANNVLNHVVMTSWVTNISSRDQFGLPSFGLPSAFQQMRSMNMTLRVRF